MMQDKIVTTQKKVTKGRGDGSGPTPPRRVRIPEWLWQKAAQLGIDRAGVMRSALEKAVRSAEKATT